MDGRNWNEKDSYTFSIEMKATGLDGQTPLTDGLPTLDGSEAGGTVSEPVPNEDGDGYSWTVTIEPRNTEVPNTYRFNTGKLTYTHVGIYTYTIKENASEVANVTSDTATYTVKVTVTDENGVLKRETDITPAPSASGTLDFTNTYVPTASTSVPADFELTKVFADHEWTDEYAFEFILSPVDGAPMPAEDKDAGVTIDDEGKAHKTVSGPDAGSEDTATFDFGGISYSTAGNYRYKVTEGVQSSNVTYDETIYHVTVEVKDNTETGCLEAGVNYEDSDGAPLFVNTYTEPKKEVPAGDDEEIIPGVETGDTVEIIPVLFAMVTAISVIIAMSAVMIRRRRK